MQSYTFLYATCPKNLVAHFTQEWSNLLNRWKLKMFTGQYHTPLSVISKDVAQFIQNSMMYRYLDNYQASVSMKKDFLQLVCSNITFIDNTHKLTM